MWCYISAVATTALVLLTSAEVANQPAHQDLVSYDEFMLKHSPGERIGLFNRISPENRSTLMRTHLQRTIAARSEEFTPEQLAFLREAISVLTPEMYSEPKDEEKLTRMRELFNRAAALFGQSEAQQTLSLEGKHVPQKQ